MKKKIMAVTLCLAMVSTFAVGCGQKNETDSGKSEEKSSGKVEIEFVQVKREAAESYTKVIEAFEKENPDIVIKQNVVPDAQEVLMTRASSDSLPDMMNHWPTDAQFVQFEDEGLLLDLSEKDYMKNIDSKYLDAVKAKDGKNYIAPYNVNFMGVYYNKDKFEEAGYTMPTKWDELIALAEEIKAKGETPFILPNKDSWTVSNLWSNIEARDLGSHEDEFEKMKAGEESFETIPEYKSSVEKMIQLLDYANEDSLALGYDQAINDFANGEGWMFLQGSWTLVTMLIGVYYSFTDWNGISKDYTFVGLKNYVKVLTDERFREALWFNIGYTIALVVLLIVIPLTIALALNRIRRLSTLFRSIYFIPAVISMVTVGLIWNELFYRAVPAIGEMLNIEALSTSPLGNPKLAAIAIMVVNIWQGCAIPTVLFIAGLQSVPKDLLEAATIDGAGNWARFWNVIIPYLIPVLNMVIITQAKAGLTVFDYIKVMTNGGPAQSTEAVGLLIYRHAINEGKFSTSVAESMILFVIVGVVSAFSLRLTSNKQVGE